MATNIHPERRSVTREDRARAISSGRFRGCTLWFTGLPSAGKTSVSFTVERLLCERGIPCYSLDGDNIRSGLNGDLGFSPEARTENIRRISEVAKLFADSGMIVLTSFISPYVADRAAAKERHDKAGVRFFECFVDTPLSVCEERDPKGLYAKARKGEIKGFTGVDAPYEAPADPALHIPGAERSVQDAAADVLLFLNQQGVLSDEEVADLRPHRVPECIAAPEALPALRAEAEGLPTVPLTTVDYQWLQVLSEGWAAPLTGFMRKAEFLQTLHFNTIAASADAGADADASVDRAATAAGSAWASARRHNQSVPIVLAMTDATKAAVGDAAAVALTFEGRAVAVLRTPEVFEHRNEERCARQFGTVHPGHPYVAQVLAAGPWLIGGDLEVFERVRWNDGLDEYRLTPNELRAEFARRNADAVFAFQLRNPIHNGHALLMRDTRERLQASGFKRPVLLLHPLGGWTKNDDVPLPVRIAQHHAVLEDGEFLDKENTVLAVFPSPMMYAGPTEVQWHAKARLNAGANFYIVGRDPAGMPHPDTKDSLYEMSHGREVLTMAPGLDNLRIIPFRLAAYDTKASAMGFFDPSRAAEFDFISGTRMRTLAKDGEQPPSGFMAPKAWTVLQAHYASAQ